MKAPVWLTLIVYHTGAGLSSGSFQSFCNCPDISAIARAIASENIGPLIPTLFCVQSSHTPFSLRVRSSQEAQHTKPLCSSQYHSSLVKLFSSGIPPPVSHNRRAIRRASAPSNTRVGPRPPVAYTRAFPNSFAARQRQPLRETYTASRAVCRSFHYPHSEGKSFFVLSIRIEVEHRDGAQPDDTRDERNNTASFRPLHQTFDLSLS